MIDACGAGNVGGAGKGRLNTIVSLTIIFSFIIIILTLKRCIIALKSDVVTNDGVLFVLEAMVISIGLSKGSMWTMLNGTR